MQLIDKQPRIVILCNGKFAVPAIQILGMEGYLCGIGVGDAELEFSNQLHTECLKSGIRFGIFPTKTSMGEMKAWLDEVNPDFIFSICFPFKLSAEILSFKQEGFFNFHTGPLPGYRGPMPIFEVLRYGESTTALTVHRMNEEFDEGPIILEEKVMIDNNETFGSLALKLSELSGFVSKNLAQMLHFATFIPSVEQNGRNARYFENPESDDTMIRWKNMSMIEIESLVRACNPWNSGAEAIICNQVVKIISLIPTNYMHSTNPGECVVNDQNKLLIACIEGKCIEIEILRTDKGFMTGTTFYNGLKIKSLEIKYS